MSLIEESIELEVPVRTAYNQWTQFEEFPKFMEGLEKVEQLDDKRLHWVGQIAGQRREWYSEITEQVPDKRVAWTTRDGEFVSGVVDFHYLDENHCRITVQFEYEPHGGLEKVGDALGVVKMRVKGDLKRFKDFIESRGTETGAWRGEIHQEKVEAR